MKIVSGLLVAALMVACLWTLPAYAEEEEAVLETMTVTAQKQEENVQEVPMSISVFSEQNLEDAEVKSLLDLADHVPNFMLLSNGVDGFNSPSMRGIHAFVETLTASTGLFVDGVPVLSAAGYEDMLLDIERVEVLRGPQGTLYGKNTEAGAINIITRKPDNTLRGKASAGLGEDAKKEISMHLSGPIVEDKLFFGVAGLFYQKDGYIENTVTNSPINDKQHFYGRGQLRWTPSKDLDISFTASRMQYDDGGNDMNLAGRGAATYGVAQQERKISSDSIGKTEPTVTSVSMKVEYDFMDSLRLTSITTNRVFMDVLKNMDYDYTPLMLMHTDKDSEYAKFSQEFRLDSSTDNLKWLLGVYCDKDSNDVWTSTDSIIPAMVSVSDRQFDYHAYAVFGQASYSFFDRFRLIGGLRYEKQHGEMKDHVINKEYEHAWEDISPKIALEYDVADGVMTYVSVSKGVRSGGFNTYATDPNYTRFDSEILWSYELGVKSQFLDDRLIFNSAVYYMDIEDMQVNEAVSPVIAFITNAAQATAYGVEAEATAKVSRNWTLMGGCGYSHITFDKFSDVLGDYKGNTAPYAPKYTYNLGAQYRNENGLFGRVDLLGYGKMYFGKENKYSREAYELVNAKVGYEMEKLDVYAYAKNLFDRRYDSVGLFDGFYTVYSKPREVGLTVSYRF